MRVSFPFLCCASPSNCFLLHVLLSRLIFSHSLFPSIYFSSLSPSFTLSIYFVLTDSISPLTFLLVFPVLASINTGGLLHELSNEGARAQFEDFLESMILPAMVFSAEVRVFQSYFPSSPSVHPSSFLSTSFIFISFFQRYL